MVTIGHCTWKTKCIFGSISASVTGIFPKIHTSRPSHTRCKLCCDRPLTKGIVLAGHSTFSVVSWAPLKGFLQKFAPIIFHCKRCKFGCEWPIIKGTLFQEQCDFVYTSPSIGGIFLKLQTSHVTRMHYNRCKIKRYRSNILLEEQSKFWSVSRLALEGLSWILILRTSYARAKNTVSLVEIGHYEHGEISTFLAVYWLWPEGLSLIVHSLQYPRKCYQRCKFNWDRLVIKRINLSLISINFGSQTIDQIMLFPKI